MPIPLMEGERGAVPFIVNRTTPFVTENRNGVSFTRIPGRFSICDSVNGNNRRYPKKVWEKNLADGSALRQAIAKNAAFGLLEHPSNGQISLQSPICILVTEAKLQSAKEEATGKEVNEVVGEIIIVNTPEGQKLKALIEVGYNPLVSSRGFGSVIKASDGVDDVQEDFVCEGWDTVLKPSFEKAELWPKREGQSTTEACAETEGNKKPKQEQLKGVNIWNVFQHLAEKIHNKTWQALTDSERNAIAEKINAMSHTELSVSEEEFMTRRINDAAVEDVSKAASSPTTESPAAPAAGADNKLTEKSMNINEIKSRISVIKGTGVPKDPARFAEGMNELGCIHQEIANWLAEDAKRTYQAGCLHEEVKTVERSWSEAQLAPSKQATKLHESYTKVLKVTKVLGEAAIGIRRKLSEALSQNAEGAQLIEELTERGQAWVALADKRKESVADLEHKLEVACEALDLIKARYHEDMTELGRRVITLEFAEKAQAPEIQKLLKEAKRPKDIIAIREKLDPEGAAATKAKQESDKECEKCHKKPCECKEEGKKFNEAKQHVSAPAAAAESSPGLGEARVLVPSVRSISESVAMAQRLSASGKDKKDEGQPAK